MRRRPPRSTRTDTLFPYTTLFRSDDDTCPLAAAATEPLSGSDSILPYNKPDGGVRMTAKKKGDRWVLNGEKRYISNGGLAKVIYVMARTDMRKPPLKSLCGFMLTSDTDRKSTRLNSSH